MLPLTFPLDRHTSGGRESLSAWPRSHREVVFLLSALPLSILGIRKVFPVAHPFEDSYPLCNSLWQLQHPSVEGQPSSERF